ncbi:MAG: tRNA (N6-isopentenyl adenosine(37)-C2)-methylthiotransferase MiaB [Spirochaetaceae bacterium]|nr:tRNA (N6-isopentenyl adenosine(37)-C2)-methylthiotransferase MiaB [Spirochaetaceae bacterium]
MKYFFETYGCQMNKAESSSVEQILIERGWNSVENPEDANLVIINTCSVRATAETRIHGRLGWYSALKKSQVKQNKNPITVVVMGCMAQRLLESLKKQFPVVDYVVGNFQKPFFTEIFEAVETGRKVNQLDETPVYSFASTSYEQGSFSAFVPIMHGCNNFCTYCIVPYVRGREISRSPKDILSEIDQLSAHGVKEITLLGQNVNSFCWNETKSISETASEISAKSCDDKIILFPQLMKMIAEHLKKTNSPIKWVRFMSSHPKDLSDELIKVISEEEVLCKHIHLPVQHGSSNILQRMNRRYTREKYLDLVKKIKKQIPEVSLTTDILIGFPGETEDEFEETVSLMKEINYLAAYMYYYNPREGTPACSYENQIPMEDKKRRLAKIIDIQQEITKTEMKKQLGKTVKVLVENVSRDDESEMLGRTSRDERVVFKADKSLIGSFVEVKIESLNGNTFKGCVI